jgi:hypothetical protein
MSLASAGDVILSTRLVLGVTEDAVMFGPFEGDDAVVKRDFQAVHGVHVGTLL